MDADFCLLLTIWGEILVQNASKNLGGKYSQKLIDHAKQSATDALKTIPKRAIYKTIETTGDLIENKIADSKTSS